MDVRATEGPVKAWIEPDRWALWRASPRKAALLLAVTALSIALGYAAHPAFFVLSVLSVIRHAALEAKLRELFREGMLHPARILGGALLATLVRLEQDGRTQDAIVVSRMPRRWSRNLPPWGGSRAAMVIAGDAPALLPLSPDVAVRDPERALRAVERIPPAHWQALERALDQVGTVREGVYPVELGRTPWYGSVRDLEQEGSLPAHLEGQPHRWCAGLPCVEQPQMAEAERARVRKLRRVAIIRTSGVVLAYAAILLGASLAAVPEPLRAGLSLVVLLGAPFVVLYAGRHGRRARMLGRDLARRELLRFTGTLSNFDSLALDRDLAQLARRGLFVAEPGIEQDMVVLPETRELLHANGRWAVPGLSVRVSEVASPPEHTIKLPLPLELHSERAAQVDLGRRRFSDAERSELLAHVRELRRPGAAILLLTPIAFALLVAWTERADWQGGFASAPFVLALWVLTAQAYYRRLRLGARLTADLELGWVITVDHRAQARTRNGEELELPACGIESLQHARLDWTVNRRPASWRRAGA